MNCIATTKTGKQCSRKGKPQQNNKCLQHFKIESNTQRPVNKIADAKEESLVPSQEMIEELNRVADLLNMDDERETYWVDDLPSQYRLKMEDMEKAKKGLVLYVFPPQTYEEIVTFEKSNDFCNTLIDGEYCLYEYNGDAVTGSGCDTWGVYRPGLLDEMKKLL